MAFGSDTISGAGRGGKTRDVRALAAELRRGVRGEVRFDDGTRAAYATDASNYRQVPIGVVLPSCAQDVEHALVVARRFGVPILPRGGGTSLAGQCCNVALVLDFSKHMSRVLEIDAERRRARVEPGAVLDRLRERAVEHGLTFGPDPSTHNHCTLGGMIGNDSCGVHSVLSEFHGPGARTSDHVEELEVLTARGLRLRVGATSEPELERIIAAGGERGELYRRLRELRDRHAKAVRERYPRLARTISGYDLRQLLPEHGFHVARALAGTEGTCVTVLEATLALVPDPRARCLLVLGFPDIFQAADRIPEIRRHRPIGLEGLDDVLVGDLEKKGMHSRKIRMLPAGRGWLLVEFGGDTPEQARERARLLAAELARDGRGPSVKLFADSSHAKPIWQVRESGLGATARVPGQADAWEGWEDSAVPPERLGSYLRRLRALLERHGYHGALYGHFGQGCVHTRIDFDLTSARGIQRFRAFLHEAAALVVAHGGSLSGEHGDGQSRAELLGIMYGPELVAAFREFKAIWDPDGRMNPGKVVDAYRADENLRLGRDYAPPSPTTHFQFPGGDAGSLARATLRCVGVGECRRAAGGTMCPSYRVTHEEIHSTRGRAHLLFEMLQGDVVRRGWRDRHVREALDLCLACKACKSECPVNVDLATYKAEFLSHYYAGRLRPLAAYSMGLIPWWSRLAALAPDVVNGALQTRPLGALARRLAGIAPERRIPRFASETFVHWFRRRRVVLDLAEREAPPVLLWPDTFNNHFHPETARAAVDVLSRLGYAVSIPRTSLCCGRPLYDFGMLPTAKRMLRHILDALRPEIRAGVPLVGLEPSCVAVFRDELLGLFPHDQDARRLAAQSFLLSEFLADATDGRALPKMRGKALVHGHCHHKSVLNFDSERRVLERAGVEAEILDSGCCGMAGSFGFERGHYDVSTRIGELVLLPAVRRASPDTWIVADGFSCREQIEQGTPRRAVHLAELLSRGLSPSPGLTGTTFAAL